jgi:predicted small lipoprotein YifL
MAKLAMTSLIKSGLIKSGLIKSAVVVALAGMLAACGVKGSLETPQSAQAAQAGTASADSGQGKAEGAAPKPHKPFILDSLVR